MRSFITVTISMLLLLFSNTGLSQTDSTNIEKQINVFFDCGSCDLNFFRNNLPHCNIVRDRTYADCHIIFFTQRTGAGGNLYELQFVGVDNFSKCTDTIKFSTPNQTTSDEKRKTQLKYIKLGLIPFWLRAGLANQISVDINGEATKEKTVKDKWNNWVFYLNTSLSTRGQASVGSFTNNNSIRAQRVTAKNRFETGFWNNYSQKRYELTNPDTTIYTKQKSWSSSIVYTHALSRRFSSGGFVNTGSSIFDNYNFYIAVKPGIEFNVFDYSHFNNKQIRIGYRVGPRFNKYIKTTIFNRNEEYLLHSTFSIDMKFKQTWGSISYSLRYNNYLHDLALYSFNQWAYINIRLFKGLSWSFGGGFNLIQDQIYLPLTEASDSDILLQQQQLKTGYKFWMNTGLRFTFGSIYNDVVNPRFGF